MKDFGSGLRSVEAGARGLVAIWRRRLRKEGGCMRGEVQRGGAAFETGGEDAQQSGVFGDEKWNYRV